MGEKEKRRFEVTIKDSKTGRTDTMTSDQFIFCGINVKEEDNTTDSKHYFSGEFRHLSIGYLQLGGVIDHRFRQQNTIKEE